MCALLIAFITLSQWPLCNVW